MLSCHLCGNKTLNAKYDSELVVYQTQRGELTAAFDTVVVIANNLSSGNNKKTAILSHFLKHFFIWKNVAILSYFLVCIFSTDKMKFCFFLLAYVSFYLIALESFLDFLLNVRSEDGLKDTNITIVLLFVEKILPYFLVCIFSTGKMKFCFSKWSFVKKLSVAALYFIVWFLLKGYSLISEHDQ